jgi:hypothetical protein
MTPDSSTPTTAECKCDPHVEYCDACLPPSVRAGVAPPAAAEPQSITIDHLPGTTGDSLEDGIAYLKAAAAEPLSDALRALIRAYVNLLENGRDRIRMLGGECDDVPTMERSDPHLRAARAALSTHAAPARNGGETGEKRCQYCDGTGDVHGIDGEWRGACDCGAAQVNSTWNDVRREAVAIAGRRGLGDLLAAVHNYGAACARAAQPPAEQAAREVSEPTEAQIDVARDFAGLPRHIPVAGGAVYDLLPGLCRMVEHLRRASAHPAAPQPASAGLCAVAAELLEWYADWIKRHVMSANIEEHPYLPQLEEVAERLRVVVQPASAQAIQAAVWDATTVLNRRHAGLIKAAVNLIAACHDRQDNHEPPLKYTIPYGEVVALK